MVSVQVHNLQELRCAIHLLVCGLTISGLDLSFDCNLAAWSIVELTRF